MSRMLRSLATATAVLMLLTLGHPIAAAPRLSWLDHFGGSSDDWARGVAVTSDAVYVVGQGNPQGAVANNFIRRYDLRGDVEWTVGIEPRTGFLHLVDVGATRDGAYVLGSARSGRGTDVLVAKVTSDGDVDWTARLGTTASDSASSLSVDASGLVVAGSTRGAFPGQTLQGETDAFVARLDTDGDLVWARQFGTRGADGANAVWAGDGAVYVAGPTSGELSADGHVGSVDAYVRKLDGDGAEVWTRQLGTTGVDSAFALDADAEGVAVAGTTDDAMPGARHLGSTDAFLTLLTPDGDRVWTHQFGGEETDAATAVAVDGEAILVGGSAAGDLGGVRSRGSSDAVLWTFATSGAMTELLRFGTASRDLISDADAGESGRFVAGVAPGAWSDERWDGEDAFVGRLRTTTRVSSRAIGVPLAAGTELNPRPFATGTPGGAFDADPIPQPPSTGPEPTPTTPAPSPSETPSPTETPTPSPSPDDPGNGNGNGNGNGGGNGGGGGGGGDETGPTGATGVTGTVEDLTGAAETMLTIGPLGVVIDSLL